MSCYDLSKQRKNKKPPTPSPSGPYIAALQKIYIKFVNNKIKQQDEIL